MKIEDIVELQRSWCDSGSDAIRNGAREAVDMCSIKLGELGIELGQIVEIGPQYGFGMERWVEIGAHNPIGLELVPKFSDSCRDKGLTCLEASAEEMDSLPEFSQGQKYNWYMRDTMEHFYDGPKALGNVLDRLDQWVYVSVPIEPEPGKDKAHLWRLESYQMVHDLFAGLNCVHEKYRPPSQKSGRLEAIWTTD